MIGGLSQESGSVALDLCDVAWALSDIKCCSHQIWEIAAAWLIVIGARGMILRDTSELPGMDMLCEPFLGLKNFIAVRPMMKKEQAETLVMDYKVLVK